MNESAMTQHFDILKHELNEIKHELDYLNTFSSEFNSRLQALSEIAKVKNFEYESLYDEYVNLNNKNENIRKIVDLLDIEISDIQSDNKFSYEKYYCGKDINIKLEEYSKALDSKQIELQQENEYLRKMINKKQDILNETKLKEIIQKEEEIENLNLNSKTIKNENIDYLAKTKILENELKENLDLIIKERAQLSKILETNVLYDQSIENARLNVEKLDDEIKFLKDSYNYFKSDIVKNSLNYEELKLKFEKLLKNLSLINKNYLNLTNYKESSIVQLENKKNEIVKRNEKIDLAQFHKGKIIDSLKELSTIKNYINISLAKKDRNDDIEYEN